MGNLCTHHITMFTKDKDIQEAIELDSEFYFLEEEMDESSFEVQDGNLVISWEDEEDPKVNVIKSILSKYCVDYDYYYSELSMGMHGCNKVRFIDNAIIDIDLSLTDEEIDRFQCADDVEDPENYPFEMVSGLAYDMITGECDEAKEWMMNELLDAKFKEYFNPLKIPSHDD